MAFIKSIQKNLLELKSQVSNNDTIKILCFGDSITKGYTYFGTEYYPYSDNLAEYISRDFPKLKFKLTEKGENGERVVDSMESRLVDVLKKDKYDYVILMGGLNDLADISVKQKTIEDVIEAFKAIYATLEENANVKKFIHISVPNCVVDTKNNGASIYAKSKNTINDTLMNMENTKRIFLDLREHNKYGLNSIYLDENERNRLWDDGLHFTKEGYELLSENIYNVLKDILNKL